MQFSLTGLAAMLFLVNLFILDNMGLALASVSLDPRPESLLHQADKNTDVRRQLLLR
jgi:hypothetical protein